MGAELRERKIFVAGSTGATGRTLLRIAGAKGLAGVVPHVRPQSAARAPSGAAVVDLADHGALVRALEGVTTVVQLIGTMRKRFSRGDTYETSDIGTTRQLVEAAKVAGVDHVVLLSSVGAGKPAGAYLKAKAEAERIVRESGIPWTIFRPSAFVGEEHQPPKVLVALGERFAPAAYRPIRLEALAGTILNVARSRGPLDAVLEGKSLWAEVARAQAAR